MFLDPFSEEVWKTTYRYNGETLDETFRRVARAVASVEKTESLRREWEEKFYEMISTFKVVPGGRILTNAGTDWRGTTLLNCFVGPRPENPFDSIEGIYEVLLKAAQTLKSEGGWGWNFSAIRPRGSFINGIGVESPGAVKFMELFDKSAEIITAGSGKKPTHKKAKGKIRKGAQMAILDVWHPDIIEFITAKQTPGRLTKFNMSVNCTNEFMNLILQIKKLRENGVPEEEIEKIDVWNLEFPDTTYPKYNEEWDGNLRKWKEKGYPTVVHKQVKASWLWNLITTSTYNRNEPGVVFLDRANEYFSSNYVYEIYATNPCGEQTLPMAGVCNLGSLNVTQFVDEDTRDLRYDEIAKYAKYLVRFLDNVNDLTNLPLKDYEDFVRSRRRIGCGIIGWGSALLMMKVRFASEKAAEIREKLMSTFARACHEASIDLAIEKGCFDGCDPEKHLESKYLKTIGLSPEYLEKLRLYGIRNSSLMSCQPTGNTSIFANVISGGIEPVFSHEYVRTVIVPESQIPEHLLNKIPEFWEGKYYETEMFKWTKEGDEDILRGVDEHGVVYKIDRNRGLTKEVPCIDYGVRWLKERGEWNPNAEWAVTALDLTVEEHLNDLCGFAKYVDSSISKTINVPHDYPFEKFVDVYYRAYESGYVKGVTTYRLGTMASVLSTGSQTNNGPKEEIILEDVKLPESSPAYLKILRAEGKKWYLTVVLDDTQSRPIALFVTTNSPEKNVLTYNALEKLFELAERKGIPQKHIEDVKRKISGDNNSTKIARTISLLLRHGVLPKSIVAELETVDAPVTSFVYQIKKFLGNYINDGERITDRKCSECGQMTLEYREGCIVCVSCGVSKC